MLAPLGDDSSAIRESSASTITRPFLVKRSSVVSSTNSPLAQPQTPIHELAARLSNLMYFPDPGPLYVVCATLAANTMTGYPVWLMLVGPPESGKTELLRPLLQVHGVREMGDLSSKGGLLSGTKQKERAADATGGLLKDLPRDNTGTARGCLLMFDFARMVLSGDMNSGKALLGAIGMIHDQHYQREVGTDGGKILSFNGRVGWIGATTESIDHPQHQEANAEMGERCVFYRLPCTGGRHEINAALDNLDGSVKRDEIASAFAAWVDAAALDWDDTEPARALTAPEKRRLTALAQLCAWSRSLVSRHRFTNEILVPPHRAQGPRTALTLARLLLGLERIGCTSAESWDVVSRCAADSIPPLRKRVLWLLYHRDRLTLQQVGDAIPAGPTQIKIALQDLEALGLTHGGATDGRGSWELDVDTDSLIRAGWES